MATRDATARKQEEQIAAIEQRLASIEAQLALVLEKLSATASTDSAAKPAAKK